MSILSTEFRDETLEITDDCKKNRDILNGVLGERSILNTCFGIWVFSRHYILFRGHYKKIFRFGLNSYHHSSYRLCFLLPDHGLAHRGLDTVEDLLVSPVVERPEVVVPKRFRIDDM